MNAGFLRIRMDKSGMTKRRFPIGVGNDNMLRLIFTPELKKGEKGDHNLTDPYGQVVTRRKTSFICRDRTLFCLYNYLSFSRSFILMRKS